MPAITIVFGEMTPVDKYEEKEGGARCPLPTTDARVNAENKAAAVEAANYRDPAGDGGFSNDEVCGNCAAFNQTEDILDCIGDDSGDLGFCQLLKFVCSAEYVCDKWATGGPITSDIEDGYNENL
jgi:hypothetical protein